MLLALDGELGLAGPRGARTLPLAELFRGYKELDLAADEIIDELAKLDAETSK